MKENNGRFERWGRSIDRDFEEGWGDIREGLKQVQRGLGLGDAAEEANEEAVMDLLVRQMSDVLEPAGADFSYPTVLRWVKAHHVGNRFYMVRHSKGDDRTYLFVFFAKGSKLLLGDKDPKVCYLCKPLPEGISDVFNGKDIYIQSFTA